MDPRFTIVQIVYWLALATWFGGVLFIAVAAPIIFRTVRESDPTLPAVLSVNMEGQHATLLAGSIVANLLRTLLRLQLICGAAILLALIGQWALLYPAQLYSLVIRTALYLAAVMLAVYDWRVVSPRIYSYRQQYIDNADEPEIANPAKEQFDRYHNESVTLLTIELAVLLGLVLFSASIGPLYSSFAPFVPSK
ncbi:MAG: hypothetical protein JWO87_1136 [Phycisphaerales bacterium]|nr:hypothetical protein [Phycisphaerales bacterium]MDB5299473.1 hypothetical protein [Phycisphaerales bacterium]